MKINPRFTTDYKDFSILIKAIRVGMINNQYLGEIEGGDECRSVLKRGGWDIKILRNIKAIQVYNHNLVDYTKSINYDSINLPIEKLYDKIISDDIKSYIDIQFKLPAHDYQT